MVLLEKRAHLVLETTLGVVPLLRVDVLDESIEVGGANREEAVPALPREPRHTLGLYPLRGSGFEFRHKVRRRFRCNQPDGKMNMVGDTASAKTFTTEPPDGRSEICMKIRRNVVSDQWQAVLRAEDDMHQVHAVRLRHGGDYMSGLQPSGALPHAYLGLRPRLLYGRAFGPKQSQMIPPSVRMVSDGCVRRWVPERMFANNPSALCQRGRGVAEEAKAQDAVIRAEALMGTAQTRRDQNDRISASIYLSEAITLLRNSYITHPDEISRPLAHALRHAAEIRSELREYAVAGTHIQEAVRLYRAVSPPMPLDLANALRVSALNDEREAHASWVEAEALYREVDVQEGVAECRAHLDCLQPHETPDAKPQEQESLHELKG